MPHAAVHVLERHGCPQSADRRPGSGQVQRGCGYYAQAAASKAVFHARDELADLERKGGIPVEQLPVARTRGFGYNPVFSIYQHQLGAGARINLAFEKNLQLRGTGAGVRRPLKQQGRAGRNSGKHGPAGKRALPENLFLHNAVGDKAGKRCRQHHQEAQIPENRYAQAYKHGSASGCRLSAVGCLPAVAASRCLFSRIVAFPFV